MRQIKDEVFDILAYFPGRQRFSFAWLFLLPLCMFVLPGHFVCASSAELPPDHVPYYLFASVGKSMLWIYFPSVMVCLLRINHWSTRSFSRLTYTVFASVLYGLVIGFPAVAVTAMWATLQVGISIQGLVQCIAGLVMLVICICSMVAVLGGIAYCSKLLIPGLLLLAHAYIMVLPLAYSIGAIPDRLRPLHMLAVPLASEITIARNAILNSTGNTHYMCWIGSVAHTVLGVAVIAWLLNRGRISEQGQPLT